ncbi:CRTAC1 family protein [Flagellimonas flava]|uniref:CRTAC1 family protein n=1 Tax=Flagellimonas flava TaxID=570519 RepID=UPI003D659902
MRKLSLANCLILLCPFLLQAQKMFTDVTEDAGIDHQFLVYEGTFGGGAVVFDINNDGLEDLYITGGTTSDVLYLNQGEGKFKNVFEGSGLEVTADYVTQGVASADVNKDGWRDLFITTINSEDNTTVIPRAKNLLFINNGDGTFTDATTAYGLKEFNSFSTGASFGDVNADGYPDLYVGNYFVEFTGKLGILKDATIASAHQTSKDYLFINKEGKHFENQYEEYNLGHKGFGFGSIFTDYDNDGDQDIFVHNDFGYKAVPNFLYKNRSPWKGFKDVSEDKEMDLKINAMGAAVGDYNEDGLLDYFVTNIKFNYLMQNQGGNKPFVNVAKETGAYSFAISWGANFADFDHDTDLDIYVSNGDLNPNCNPMANFYYDNQNGSFVENASLKGINDPGVGRGSVVFDMDNDGDLDILVVNQKPIHDNYRVPSVTKLFRNDGAKGNWFKVALKGTASEANGIGARVEVFSDGKHMIREIDGGNSSHMSQNSAIAHFGLGTANTVERIVVTWAGGKKQELTNQKANTSILIMENPESKTSFWIYAIIGLAVILATWLFLKYKKR